MVPISYSIFISNIAAFKKSLNNVIESFEKAREWADLSNCLQKVKKHFELNPGLDIPLKKDLAKRLAQCLNPDLNVIHSLTLDVYGMIFARQIELMKEKYQSGDLEWGSDLGQFYSGLFNFYQFATFGVKEPFLQIIENYVLQLEKELLMSLSGFMVCMLPALEDQNAHILKKVESILAKTEEIVGTRPFYGEIWKAMLRTPRTRLSAIKYLEKRIPKDLEIAKTQAKMKQIFVSKNTMKIQDEKVILEKDQEIVLSELHRIEQMTLDDYFYFYYPIKEKLAINSLLAGLADPSVYVNRGVIDLLITHMPITGNINTLVENVRLVDGALMTLLKKDFAFLKKFFTWFLSHLDDENYVPNHNDPAIRTLVPALQCMFTKFSERSILITWQQSHQRIQGGGQATVAGDKYNPSFPILILQTLLNDNGQIIEPILEQISVDLIKYIKNYYYDTHIQNQKARFNENVNNLFDMVQNQLDCIYRALGSLLSDQIRRVSAEYVQDTYFLETIELIDFCLRDLKLGSERPVQNFSVFLIPILSTLLSTVVKLTNYMQNLENALPALELIENTIHILDREDPQKEDMEQLKRSVEDFNNFYVSMCVLMTQNEDVQYDEMFKLRFDIFKKASQILNQIQKYSNAYQLNQIPEWLKMVIECSKTKKAKIVLVSIETFISILSKNSGPLDPIKQLQNLIVKYDPNVKIDSQKPIYVTLQQTKNPYCTDIIKTLWSLLDEEEDHEKIVSLLKKFDGLLPKIFSEVVTDELNCKDREVKIRAIKKFSIFWKLTAKDYTDYKPFYEKDTDLRRYVALHHMLHILEDNDPTLRLSCKSWLSESKLYYRRILDPLLEEFLQNSKVFVTSTGQIFFIENYETSIVIQNFSKLRNIIINTKDEMIQYIMMRNCTEYIQKDFDDKFHYMKQKKKNDLRCQNKYLLVIVQITLQFIMGQAVESVNEQLYQESETVNASACEFMELILKSLEQHKEYANEIAHLIIDPILKTFRQVIDNQKNAMQVHMLGLLKVIFFQCNFDSPESKQECEKIFKGKYLIDSIVKGMKKEVSFVRYHFIQFAEIIIPFMQTLIKPSDFTIHIKKFIDCFCQLLQHVDVTLFATQSQVLAASQFGEGSQDMIRGSRALKATIVAVQKHHLRGGEHGNPKALDFNLINQETDIQQIINGLEQILNYCLGILKDQNKIVTNAAIQEDFLTFGRNQQIEPSLGEKLRGFFGGSGVQTRGTNVIMHGNDDVKNSIYEKFPNIIVSCLYCWNYLPIFLARDYNFARCGMYPYTQDDEKILGAMIEKSGEKDFDEYIKANTNQIQKNVIDFLQPLAEHSIPNFIEGILNIWLTKSHLDGQNINKSLEKMMQILISLKLTPHSVINSINKYIEKNQLMSKRPNSKKVTVLTKSDSQRESLICYFLYCYLLYNTLPQIFQYNQASQLNLLQYYPNASHQQIKTTEADNLAKIYSNVLKFIKFFYISKHPSTVCWLLEILFILSAKFTANDAYKQETKLRKEYNELLTQLLTNTASILSDGFNVIIIHLFIFIKQIEFDKEYGFKIAFPPTVYELLRRYDQLIGKYNTQLNQQSYNKDSKQRKPHEDFSQEEYKQDYTLKSSEYVMKNPKLPFKISIDSLFSDEQHNPNNQNYYFDEKDKISEFMYELSEYIGTKSDKQVQQCPSFLLLRYFKFFTIITIKSILYPMVQSILVHNNHDKITAALSIIVSGVLQILNNKQKQDKDDTVIREVITDFFSVLMDKANLLLVKPYKREISDIFLSDNFFQMSRRTLRKWCKIINHFIMDQKTEVFDDLVYKWNTQAGVFTSKDFEIKQKCIALKRVAFLVFAGDLDQYEDQLELLLKKMTDGFKTNKMYKNLRIQLFLLTRVLLLRLHPATLAEALRKLWPHLLDELVSIFEDKEQDYQLLFEAIKTIELMSCLNIEDFQMKQWIFLVDAIGMKFEGDAKIDNQFSALQLKNKLKDEANLGKGGAEFDRRGIFQPFIVKFMQDIKSSFYNQTQTENVTIADLLQNKKSPFEQRKTSINISPENYNKDALMNYAINLQFHLNESNMEKTEIDRLNAEALIEKDFIELD